MNGAAAIIFYTKIEEGIWLWYLVNGGLNVKVFSQNSHARNNLHDNIWSFMLLEHSASNSFEYSIEKLNLKFYKGHSDIREENVRTLVGEINKLGKGKC